MIVSYIVSFLGMLAWAWGSNNANWAGKGLGIILLVVAVILTIRNVTESSPVNVKDLLFKFGVHAVIWLAGILLYEYIMMALTIVATCIAGYIFFSLHEDDSSPQKTQQAYDMPHFITDDLGREWVFDGAVGYGVRYRVHTEAGWSAQMDANDSLYNGTVLIESKNISGNTAKLLGRSFHW